MPNSRIVSCEGGDRIQLSPFDDELLRAPGTCLLWPDGTGMTLDMDQTAPDRVVVLDGTWRQARRLYSRMPVLRAIPRLVLPAPIRARNRLREQNLSDGMSTLEVVAAAVAKLEGTCVAEPLEKPYDEVVRRTIASRVGIKPS